MAEPADYEHAPPGDTSENALCRELFLVMCEDHRANPSDGFHSVPRLLVLVKPNVTDRLTEGEIDLDLDIGKALAWLRVHHFVEQMKGGDLVNLDSWRLSDWHRGRINIERLKHRDIELSLARMDPQSDADPTYAFELIDLSAGRRIGFRCRLSVRNLADLLASRLVKADAQMWSWRPMTDEEIHERAAEKHE